MKQSLQRGFFFLAFSFLFTIFPNLVQAESINNFNTKISVQKDATIRVEERIEYDFGSLSKHGIYRDISTVILNQDGKKYRLEVQIVSVLDETGNPYHYTTPSMGGEILRIKIGDANRFVTGLKTYIITYQARGAMRYFSEHDELYWNMTGDKWDVFIENAFSCLNSHCNINVPDSHNSLKALVCHCLDKLVACKLVQKNLCNAQFSV